MSIGGPHEVLPSHGLVCAPAALALICRPRLRVHLARTGRANVTS